MALEASSGPNAEPSDGPGGVAAAGGCKTDEASPAECNNVIAAVHELCGEDNAQIEEVLACYDESTLDCERAEANIEPFVICDERAVVGTINQYGSCDPLDCPTAEIDCSDSPFATENGFDFSAAFGDCITWAVNHWYLDSDADGLSWAVAYSLCRNGECVPANEIAATLCPK